MTESILESTKSDSVYHRIRKMIESGQVSNGQRLSEAHFARLFGVSRGPVRDSLKRLESEGLVKHRGSRRSRVVSYTEDEDHDELIRRYEVRQFIEAAAAGLAALHMSALQVERLRGLSERATACRKSGDLEGRYSANMEFHRYLVQNCGNSLFAEIYDSYRLAPRRVRTEEFRKRFEERFEEGFEEEGVAESQRLGPSYMPVVDAIAAHDFERASHLMLSLLQRVTEALRRMVW